MSHRSKWISVLALFAALIPQALADSGRDTKLSQLQAERNLLEKQTIRQRAEIAKLKQEIDTLKKQLAAKSANNDTSEKPVPTPDPPKQQLGWPKEWETSFQQARSELSRRMTVQKAALKTAIRNNDRKGVLQARREMKRIENGEERSPSASLNAVKLGARVHVDANRPDTKVQVVQVIGPMSFRGVQDRAVWGMGDAKAWPRGTKRFPTVYFDGVSTKGMVDGADSEVTGYFIVSGTRTYTTADSALRTEFVLTPLDIVKWREAYKNWEKANPVQKKPSRRK